MSFIDPLTGDAAIGDDAEIENPNAQLALNEGGYEAPDVETDQDAISQQVFTRLALTVPGWQAHDGNLDTWLVEAWAEVGAEIRSLAADVPASIFATYGTLVLGIPPKLATNATGLATFTAVDNQGYTLDMASTFALARSGDDLVAFQTLQEVTIPPGSTWVDNVPFTAVLTGAAANGMTGDGQMLDPVTWVDTIEVSVPTASGQDAETPDDYLDRLTNLLRMVALRPILPQDFAILALQHDGVGRAVAMNLYNPADGSWDNPRTVTVMIAQADGTPCGADVKADVKAQLESLREVNWVVNVIDPTYEPVDVTFDVVAYAGQDNLTVNAACVSALTAYVSPGNFRLGVMSPAIAGGEVIPPPDSGQPAPRQSVYVNELIALLDRTLGVDRVVSVEIDGEAADHQLAQPYTLPTPGTISGTVEGGTGGPAGGSDDSGGGGVTPQIDSIDPPSMRTSQGAALTLNGTFPVPFPDGCYVQIEPTNDPSLATPSSTAVASTDGVTARVYHDAFSGRAEAVGPAKLWILAADWSTVISNKADFEITA